MSAIVHLFFSRRPTTVAGFVVPVVFDTVESQPDWALTHVGEEVCKDQPAVANRDASTAVMLPAVSFWVETANFHSRPRTVGRGKEMLSWRVTVTSFYSGHSVFTKTSAARCFPGQKPTAADDLFVSAIADADPVGVFFSRVRKAPYRQATKSLPFQLAASRHV